MRDTRKRGRRSKRTPQTAALICRLISTGVPYVHAASAAGIARSGFSKWRNADPAFEEQIQKAVALGVSRRLARIEEASEAGDWRASAWLLEHCQPQHFAVSRQLLEVTGPNGGPLGGAVAIMLPPKLESPIVNVPALTQGSRNGNGNG